MPLIAGAAETTEAKTSGTNAVSFLEEERDVSEYSLQCVKFIQIARTRRVREEEAQERRCCCCKKTEGQYSIAQNSLIYLGPAEAKAPEATRSKWLYSEGGRSKAKSQRIEPEPGTYIIAAFMANPAWSR